VRTAACSSGNHGGVRALARCALRVGRFKGSSSTRRERAATMDG
jgi:hypothetical protein